MSAKEILEKAIQKAIDGGWRPVGHDHEHPNIISDLSMDGVDKCYIFNHDFARALWGEEWIEDFPFASEGSYKYSEIQVSWKKHLQQMVISEDPIKYLGDNL